MASMKILCLLQIQEARRTCLPHMNFCSHPDYSFLMEKKWNARKIHWIFSTSCWFSCYFISSACCVSQSIDEFDELRAVGIAKRCWQWVSTLHIRFLADLIWGHPVLVLWVANSPWETSVQAGAACGKHEFPGAWAVFAHSRSQMLGAVSFLWLCSRNTWDGCCQVAVWLLCVTSCSGSSLRAVFKA